MIYRHINVYVMNLRQTQIQTLDLKKDQITDSVKFLFIIRMKAMSKHPMTI